jgi:hypothetical protein
MTFDEVFETIPTTGWLTKPEAKLLYDVASSIAGPILEVGCYYGRSTCLLAALGRPVYTVDSFNNFDSDCPDGERIFKQFNENLLLRRISNVRLFKCRIEDWMGLPVEFAYLDGDHTRQGTLNQIQAALECGAVEICLHDYSNSGGGREVKEAVSLSGISVVQIVETMVHCRG